MDMPDQVEAQHLWLDVYILACRMFENIAAGWRSDAKEQAGDLARWGALFVPSTAEDQALADACRGLIDFSTPWEERIRHLGRCMPTLERHLGNLVAGSSSQLGSDGQSTGAFPTLRECLDLLIAVNRVMDAVSCSYTGEARRCAIELREMASALDLFRDPSFAELATAIEQATDSSFEWSQRCQRLSETVGVIEALLKDAVDAHRWLHPSRKPPIPAVYQWANEFHPSRRAAVSRVSFTRMIMETMASKPPPPAVHGLHWTVTGKRNVNAPSFLASLPTGIARIHPYVVTTREWFAKKVMSRAIASARRRYPSWESHRFEEGPRVGERRLVFNSETAVLADQHIDWMVRHIADREPPPLHAFWRLRGATQGAWQPDDPEHLRASGKRAPENRVLLMVIDALDPTKEIVKESTMAWRTGVLPSRIPSIHRFGYADLENSLEWLTWPERVLLNWEAIAYDSLKDVDIDLLDSAEALDIVGMKGALDAGANPNTLHPEHGSAMRLVICAAGLGGKGDPRSASRAESRLQQCRRNALDLLHRYGAHVDLHSPQNAPVMVDALLAEDADALQWLLDHGADASIVDAGFGGPEDPIAWDCALEMLDRERPEARATIRALLDSRDSPLISKAEEEALKAELRFPPTPA